MTTNETRPALGTRFEDALLTAVRLHKDDVRKGKTTPYVAHLLGVCALVLQDGGSEDEAIAALLHDALEDHPESIRPEEILRRFGEVVLEMVQSCSDTPVDFRGGEKPPWRERKERYLAHLAHASSGARRVSLADKLYNARELVADVRQEGGRTWARFNASRDDQLWYYREVLQQMERSGQGGLLIQAFSETLAELVRLVNAG